MQFVGEPDPAESGGLWQQQSFDWDASQLNAKRPPPAVKPTPQPGAAPRGKASGGAPGVPQCQVSGDDVKSLWAPSSLLI